MRSLLLVHGAGSGPWIWDGWPGEAVDLQAGLNVGAASMLNYEAAVTRAADVLPRPLALVAWSMGALAAMMAARRVGPDRLVLLDPSPPGEVQGFDSGRPLEEGVFDPEEVYGPFPVAARPESRLARSERKRGISVPELACPTLVVFSDELAAERGPPVARFYGAEELHVPGASHWDLVLGKKAAARAVEWAR